MRVKSEIDRLENVRRQSMVTFQRNEQHANKNNHSIKARYIDGFNLKHLFNDNNSTFVFHHSYSFNSIWQSCHDINEF